jgi:hypothetical protein
MEPFSPEDPLTKLLGQARPVQPRPNFTQNVLRAARQTPQTESGWERVREFFSRGWLAQPALAGTCALLATALLGFWALKPAPNDGGRDSGGLAVNSGNPVATGEAVTTEPDVVTELDKMDQFNQLLAQQDTKSLSDSDVAALLY